MSSILGIRNFLSLVIELHSRRSSYIDMHHEVIISYSFQFSNAHWKAINGMNYESCPSLLVPIHRIFVKSMKRHFLPALNIGSQRHSLKNDKKAWFVNSKLTFTLTMTVPQLNKVEKIQRRFIQWINFRSRINHRSSSSSSLFIKHSLCRSFYSHSSILYDGNYHAVDSVVILRLSGHLIHEILCLNDFNIFVVHIFCIFSKNQAQHFSTFLDASQQ